MSDNCKNSRERESGFTEEGPQWQLLPRNRQLLLLLHQRRQKPLPDGDDLAFSWGASTAAAVVASKQSSDAAVPQQPDLRKGARRWSTLQSSAVLGKKGVKSKRRTSRRLCSIACLANIRRTHDAITVAARLAAEGFVERAGGDRGGRVSGGILLKTERV